MYILDVCEVSGLLKIIAFIRILMDAIFIIVPIGLIVMIMIDLSKVVIGGDEEASNKIVKIVMNRILYAIILFAVPYIVNLFVSFIDDISTDSSLDSQFTKCIELSSSPAAIAKIEKNEQVIKKAREEAKKEAKVIVTANKEKSKKLNSYTKNNANTIKGKGCDGVILYEDGVFYKPSSKLVPKSGVSKTKGSGSYGYNKYFYESLMNFVEAAKKAGYTLVVPTDTYGGWRSYEKQQELYSCYVNQNCNNGNLAAKPGTSNHGWAIAADLRFNNNTKAIYWAHDNASKYNLAFPVCNNVRDKNNCTENWHIEPANIQVNDAKVKSCL